MAKKITKKTSSKKAVKPTEVVNSVTPVVESATINPIKTKLSPKILSLALIVVGLALLTYKVGPYFVPAIIDNTPITRFALWNRLEKNYGTQTLDDLVNETVLEQAIKKAGIVIEQSKIDTQINNLEVQFKDLGGLDQALEQQGLTRNDLSKQVHTQLAVEEILKDKINPSEDEINAKYDSGKDSIYKDKKLEEVKQEIADELKQTKLREAFLSWFEEIKKSSKVKSFGL